MRTHGSGDNPATTRACLYIDVMMHACLMIVRACMMYAVTVTMMRMCLMYVLEMMRTCMMYVIAQMMDASVPACLHLRIAWPSPALETMHGILYACLTRWWCRRVMAMERLQSWRIVGYSSVLELPR